MNILQNTMGRKQGFTIIELLIVVVVIAVLATIAVVVYGDIQSRAKNMAVQSDLNVIAKKIIEYATVHGVYPKGPVQLETLDITVSKNAYGNHLYAYDSYFNLVYCWPEANAPDKFALVAAAASGKIFAFAGGAVRELPSSAWVNSSMHICSSAGIQIEGTAAQRDWFYNGNAWEYYAE